ncbi:phospholipid/cholesterol/gamma-HCH transport system permease protein [Gammaproteobacteria bacterium]
MINVNLPGIDPLTKSSASGFARLRLENNSRVLHCDGPWTIEGIDVIGRRLPVLRPPPGKPLTVDASGITAMDTAGAWLLARTINNLELALSEKENNNNYELNETREPWIILAGLQPSHQSLLNLVRTRNIPRDVTAPKKIGKLENIGRQVIDHLEQGYALLIFLGEVTLALSYALFAPGRLRFKAILHDLRTAGADALPIVGLISFLMGTVIAYQGGAQLRYYGANLFVVDLVGVSLLRELAPLLTAIIVAGRTGSAYTAQIGTMRVTDEIDALRTIGIDPLELLVIPKIIALFLALPLLTVYADILGVLGGMVISHFVLGVDPYSFLARFPESVSVVHYYIGLGKAPIFAAIIAVVGCFQGMRVGGSAEAVGYQVTTSVVQAIFLVIIADAIFSVLFSLLEL